MHEGLLACDSIGFHTERWRAAFVESCEALLGRGAEAERRSHANPIAVDAAEFDALALERRRARRGARRSAPSARRSSSCASIAPIRRRTRFAGFEAFGRLLERHPELHGRIGLLALLDPSRQEIPEYVDYRRRDRERAAGR